MAHIQTPCLLDTFTFNDRRSRPHVEVVTDFGQRYRSVTLKWCGQVIGERHDHLKRGKVVSTTFNLPSLPDLMSK